MDEQEKFPMDEEDDDLVELISEDGESIVMEHLATLEYGGNTYLAMTTPVDEDEDDVEEIEIVIMKIEQDENGEDIYTRPDEDEEEAVFEKLMEMLNEEDGE